MAADVSVPNNFVQGVASDADAVDANFAAIVLWLNTNAVHLDGSKTFTAVPSGPNEDPTSGNHLVRKSYIDALFTNAIPQTTFKECKVTRAAAQSIGAAATAALTFDTETADVAGFLAVPTATLTVPASAAGLYAITFGSTSPVSVSYAVAPRINGVTYTSGYSRLDATGATQEAKCGLVAWLAVGTTLQFMVTNNGVLANFTGHAELTRLSD